MVFRRAAHEIHRDAAEIVADAWRKLGLTINIRPLPGQQFSQVVWYERKRWDITTWQMVGRPERGDPDFPVPRGITFQALPDDYCCPICGAPKERFESRVKVVAGFAENQQYGLGTNSMTGNQKLLLIYGAAFLLVCLRCLSRSQALESSI